ncbi:kinase-like domain-containing protein [Gymnopilus junonius]|uniref:Kinase-like domain-containing protein n=1 Tax=Gymnopilus junonius TaxID=109634 RepID=A0A9P5NQ77_GYMJU|nr:kinase-like domain-containing protein [Gymnopilus junonius]
MSLSWHLRKTRLASLLQSQGDEDAEGIALDRLMHGQSIIGKTAKTTEIDSLRFQDKDLDVVGTLEYGQFGVVNRLVTCRLNQGVYIRKSIQKKFAMRTRDQCSPQFERDILLQALKADSPWAPHLLCAFQTPTHLNLVMDYAEGGTLWDILESSPHDGRILESDLRWWAPQIVSAIHWCHSLGFAHRDIKPHNFVLTPDAHVLLIDFGSAAPLLPPKADGSQLIPKRYCLVPCGTCDYISPEILEAHEEALVALEMEDEDDIIRFGKQPANEGYGVETDWWSLGAMLYEMAYGHFLHRLLTHAKQRLGRRNVMEITDHPLFDGIDWTTLPTQVAPSNLHLPQFVYSEPKPSAAASDSKAPPAQAEQENSESYSQGFPFSAFFQPSISVSPGLSILRPSPSSGAADSQHQMPSTLSGSWRDGSRAASHFIGFSWGPKLEAFPEELSETDPAQNEQAPPGLEATPRPHIRTPLRQTPLSANITNTHQLSVPLTWGPGTFAPGLGPLHAYTTPIKPYTLSHSPYATLPRTMTGTIRRTAQRRSVSDREAMKQLVDCVGMSARKKVLESGRKPKILGVKGPNGTGGTSGKRSGADGGSGTLRKELRFDKFATPIPGPDYSGASSVKSGSRSRSRSLSDFKPANLNNANDDSDIYVPQEPYNNVNDFDYSSNTSSSDEGDVPPSPSPSPRPGSAMSMMSMTMMSRRSGSMTPTVSGYLSGGNGTGRLRSGSASGLLLVPGDRSVTATLTGTTTTSSGGLLSIPTPSSGGGRSHKDGEFKIGQPPSAGGSALLQSKANSLSTTRDPGMVSRPPTEAPANALPTFDSSTRHKTRRNQLSPPASPAPISSQLRPQPPMPIRRLWHLMEKETILQTRDGIRSRPIRIIRWRERGIHL